MFFIALTRKIEKSLKMNILKFSLLALLLVSSSNALSISSIISSGINALNGAIMGGQFVWDNAVNPALDVLQESNK